MTAASRRFPNLFVIIILLACAAAAESGQNSRTKSVAPVEGFQTAKWGMNRTEVHSLYPSGTPVEVRGWEQLVLESAEIAGYAAALVFEFRFGKLTSAQFTYFKGVPSEHCAALQRSMIAKHGKPRTSEGAPSVSSWRSLIRLECRDLDGGDPFIQVRYESVETLEGF